MAASNKAANTSDAAISRPVGGTGDPLDDILNLCCRLLQCMPGDGVLHVSLLVVGKVRVYSCVGRIAVRVQSLNSKMRAICATPSPNQHHSKHRFPRPISFPCVAHSMFTCRGERRAWMPSRRWLPLQSCVLLVLHHKKLLSSRLFYRCVGPSIYLLTAAPRMAMSPPSRVRPPRPLLSRLHQSHPKDGRTPASSKGLSLRWRASSRDPACGSSKPA